MSDVPEDANAGCPGTASTGAGKSSACAGCPNQRACSTGEKVVDPDIELIRDRLAGVKHKLLVLSGKGGVGKSTVAASLAYAIANLDGAAKPLKVAVLDVDICGPSQARMFGCEEDSVHTGDQGWAPIIVQENLFVMSIAFLLDSRDEAIIWRGPRKNALIKQFLRDVDWGELDFLIIDTPPGTSDEHISIVQLLLQASCLDGAVIVTTPQEISLLDVRKEVNFCVKTKVPVLGVVENMCQFVCPCCSTASQLFPTTTGGAKKMCADLGLELLAQLPLDPRLAKSLDEGQSLAKSVADKCRTNQQRAEMNGENEQK
uniref:Cytosolic Fe-S cluster assembly factor NUBP1 homolog n=1 Tax=Globodera rostochiensis TaxID=31243 RepID=A0A914ICI2_GLORO